MSATWLFARSELRRRVGSLAVLLLVVAVVTATVAGSLAGARRSGSSFDRTLRRANARS